jgi:hypothetical protein
MPIPGYVSARIRTAYPDDCHVVLGSTPIVSFGDFQGAWVATLGLNPSDREFLGKGGWLSDGERRLETLQSLQLTSLTEASDDDVARIVRSCAAYFHRNPYMTWFGSLDKLLTQSLGVSYLSGEAVHLDLVQWATSPVWGHIKSKQVRSRLIDQDREFLRAQLASEGIRLVLMNGRRVMSEVEAMNIPLRHHAALVGGKSSKDEIRVGAYQGTTYIGWNRYIPTGGMSTPQRAQIADTVAQWSAIT